MSFTASRIYTLTAGKDYNPGTNGNIVVKVRATSTAGSTLITGVGAAAIARINAIVAASGTPAIIGSGISGTGTRYDLIDTGSPIGPNSFDITNPSNLTGTFEFKIFDASIPSNEDAPVMAIHVLTGGNLQFTSIQGDALTFSATNLIAGGVYYYAVGNVSALGGGTYYGLAPNLKPLYIS
jgi:hypothetical protein